MAVYTWPTTLPQTPRLDFSATRSMNIVSTPMDAGPPKRRLRGKMPEMLNVGFYMTTTQLATLETFVQSTIKGTARFDFKHPITSATVAVRIVPQSEGQLYAISWYSPTLWSVSLTLEVLP